ITSTTWSCVSGCADVTIGPPTNTLSTTATITGAPHTVTLRLTVMDSGTCANHIRTDDVILTVNQLVASSSNTPILCHGGSSTVTVSATGGATPYQGTGTFSHAAGPYSYTVTDSNSCTSTTTGTSTEPTAVGASINSQTDVLCYGDHTGSVTVAGSGGTSPYSYSIDGGSFGPSGTFSGLAAGSHTVTVKDANNCSTAQPVSITQPESAVDASINSQTNALCYGDHTGSVTVAGSGGTGPYTYSKD